MYWQGTRKHVALNTPTALPQPDADRLLQYRKKYDKREISYKCTATKIRTCRHFRWSVLSDVILQNATICGKDNARPPYQYLCILSSSTVYTAVELV
jgi:hypothetical protein